MVHQNKSCASLSFLFRFMSETRCNGCGHFSLLRELDFWIFKYALLNLPISESSSAATSQFHVTCMLRDCFSHGRAHEISLVHMHEHTGHGRAAVRAHTSERSARLAPRSCYRTTAPTPTTKLQARTRSSDASSNPSQPHEPRGSVRRTHRREPRDATCRFRSCARSAAPGPACGRHLLVCPGHLVRRTFL